MKLKQYFRKLENVDRNGGKVSHFAGNVSALTCEMDADSSS